jgi:hypothetical protein
MVLRLVALSFALLLAIQSAWLVLADFFRSGITRLPTEVATASAARANRANAMLAAKIGAIRGDLWAEAAFTYADLLWSDAKPGPGLPAQEAASARSAIDRALIDAPHRSGVWLLRAGLVALYASPDMKAGDALKMSYYTGPSEQDLMPLRLRIAILSEAYSDSELNEFVERDMRFLLSHQKSSAVAAVYSMSPPAGKRFLERAVGKIDPSAIKSLHAGSAERSLPD